MEVLRYRHDNRKNGVTLGYPEGDVGRIKTQQAFLKAMVEQLLKVENVPKVRQFIQVFQDNVETNLTFQNILWFAQAAFLGGLKAENVESSPCRVTAVLMLTARLSARRTANTRRPLM